MIPAGGKQACKKSFKSLKPTIKEVFTEHLIDLESCFRIPEQTSLSENNTYEVKKIKKFQPTAKGKINLNGNNVGKFLCCVGVIVVKQYVFALSYSLSSILRIRGDVKQLRTSVLTQWKRLRPNKM